MPFVSTLCRYWEEEEELERNENYTSLPSTIDYDGCRKKVDAFLDAMRTCQPVVNKLLDDEDFNKKLCYYFIGENNIIDGFEYVLKKSIQGQSLELNLINAMNFVHSKV